VPGALTSVEVMTRDAPHVRRGTVAVPASLGAWSSTSIRSSP